MRRYVGRVLRVGDAVIWITPRLRHQALKAKKAGEDYIHAQADEGAELCGCCGSPMSYALSVESVLNATTPISADTAASN